MELQGLVSPVPKPLPSPEDPGAVKALKNFKDKVQSGIQKYRGGPRDPRPQRQPHTNDFSRLARRICGKSIGVVLGGGGARGISHLASAALRISFHTNTILGSLTRIGRVRYSHRPHCGHEHRCSCRGPLCPRG